MHEVGTSLWATQSVNSGGRAAIRWYEINEGTNAILQSGTIGDATHDYYYPSIAANELGDVVIGFTRSGEIPSEFASSYAVVGETVAGITTFDPNPILLKLGVDDYQILDRLGRNRWGDYSATVVDPDNPCVFGPSRNGRILTSTGMTNGPPKSPKFAWPPRSPSPPASGSWPAVC